MVEVESPKMRSIWKFPVHGIGFTGNFKFEMPAKAKVLCVQTQRGQPLMWVEVDVMERPEIRFFSVFGTGWPIRTDYKGAYIGTFQVESEEVPLVFHLYEDLP